MVKAAKLALEKFRSPPIYASRVSKVAGDYSDDGLRRIPNSGVETLEGGEDKGEGARSSAAG
jgi:hypothetical protein